MLLFAPPDPVPTGRRGPKPKKGHALVKLAARVDEAREQGDRVSLQAYGQPKTVCLLSKTRLWYTPGRPPLPIQWVLVVNPIDTWPPHTFSSTDLNLAPAQIAA